MGTVDDYIHSSAGAIDLTYERRDKIVSDIEAIGRIEKELSKRGEPLPPEVRKRLRDEKINLAEVDRQISIYVRTMLKVMQEKVKHLEDAPLARLRSSEIRQVKANMILIKNMRRGDDIRGLISETMGSIITLENEFGTRPRRSKGVMSKTEQRLAKLAEYWKQSAERWRAIRKHSVKHPAFFVHGSEVVDPKRGFGKVVESDGRKITVIFDDGREAKLTMTEAIPADVAWVDSQFASVNKKIKRGDEISKQDLERIVRRMKYIHDKTKSRKKLRTYAESKRALNALIGRIQTRLTGDKMDKKEVDTMMLELEDFQRRISASDKSSWKKEDQRQWANDISKVRKSLVKLKRKKNPCVGLHFHGKDADELLRALEGSAKRQEKSKLKKNPKKKAKKPEWKAMCDKCKSLWDKYCEKPSKAKLKSVLNHLEKMKSSTSKRVKAERADCLRVANKEARRLGMK